MAENKENVLHEVLRQFNPYHDDSRGEAIQSSLGIISEKRKTFNDLLINVINPEHQDVREWDDERWRDLVCFAQDFNNFLWSLENYYKQIK